MSREGYELCATLARTTRPATTNHRVQEEFLGNLLPQCSAYIENTFLPGRVDFSRTKQVYFAEHILRAAVCHMNNLMNVLWQMKSTTTKLETAIRMYVFVKSLGRSLTTIVASSESLAADRRAKAYFTFCSASSLPVFLIRLDALIVSTVRLALEMELSRHFDMHKNEFVLALQEPWACVSCGGAWGAQVPEEVPAVFTLLKSVGIDPVLRCVDSLDGHNKQVSDESHLLGLAVNSTLQALLDSLLSRRVPFDEAGLAKLYRILLKLQDVVAELRTMLQLPSGLRLVEDFDVWKQAEAGMQVLNETISTQRFARISEAERQDQESRMAASSTFMDYSVLTREQRAQWKSLAFDSRRHSWLLYWTVTLRRWRQQNKRTVFVAMTLETHRL